MNRGADVVPKSRQRQLRGASPTADGLLGLDDANGAPGLRESDGGGEAVRAGADDDGV